MKFLFLAALLGISSLGLGQLNAAPYDPSQVTLLGSVTEYDASKAMFMVSY
jgi:hypothetical protein